MDGPPPSAPWSWRRLRDLAPPGPGGASCGGWPGKKYGYKIYENGISMFQWYIYGNIYTMGNIYTLVYMEHIYDIDMGHI